MSALFQPEESAACYRSASDLLFEADESWNFHDDQGQLILETNLSCWREYAKHVQAQARVLVGLPLRLQVFAASGGYVASEISDVVTDMAVNANRGLEELQNHPHSRTAAFLITRINFDPELAERDMTPLSLLARRYQPASVEEFDN